VGGWAVGIAVIAFLYLNDTRRFVSAENDLREVEAENRRFSALIAEKRKAEQLRDSLLAQITVIRRIDGQRFVWPHILEVVSRALPDYTWLTRIEPLGGGGGGNGAAAPGDSVQVPQLRFEVEGRTSDIQAYTRFLRQLGTSPWIQNIVAGPTSMTIELDRPVTSFTLSATYQTADSAYLRTAPLIRTLD
jgi:Tfp pilus assembly protein PilN